MMRIHWRWLLAIGLYTLLNLGANDVSAMAMHFRHWDYQLPVAIGVVTNGALIPFGIGVVLAACLGRELPGVAWPLLFAPSLLSAFEGYATDSFYAPYWKGGWPVLARFWIGREIGNKHSSVVVLNLEQRL